MALEVDGDDILPLFFGHVEDHAVAEDARDVDEDVDAPEGVDALLDHALAALGSGDAIVIGDGVAPCRLYLVGDLLRGAVVVAAAVDADAGVVDDHVGALLREQHGDGTADAAAGARHDCVSSF